MKSLIFLAALCVVAAKATFVDPEQFDHEVERTREIMQKCTDGINISQEKVRSFILGEPSDLDEESGQVVYCFMDSAGMMDGPVPRTETMCQMAMEHAPTMGEALCNIFHDCADKSQSPDGNNGENMIALRFTGCVMTRVMMSCTRALESEQ